MEIPLSKVYAVPNPQQYKLHLASWNGADRPLDVFVRNRAEWDKWNSWRSVRDDFSRDFDVHDLEERMTKLSSEELLEIVTIQFRSYRREAIDLARAELKRRGYRDADIRPPAGDSAGGRIADPFPSKLRFVVFTITVGLITFLLFPTAVYYSIVAYGLIASVFMAVGYVIWRALMQTNPRQAMGFSTGFIPPVLLVLAFYLVGTPWLVALIVAEFLVFWLALKVWHYATAAH